MTEPVNGQRSQRWTWLRAAAAGAGLEAIGYGAAGAAYAVHAVGLPEPAFAWGLAAFCGLSAAGLGALAWAMWRGRSWPATASLTWQALQVLAGLNLVGARPWLGVPLVLIGVAAGVAAAMVRRDSLADPVE